jgi:release factor glutamine methyltransferase
VKVLEAIQRSSDYLGRKGVESARLNAELLLGHVLGVARMRLYLDFERVLSDEQVERLRDLVVRRGKREPVQQITGTACFCGLEFVVNREVLTPRPETELLAEVGWKRLQEIVSTQPGCVPKALDFGTGSGCLAITLAVKCPEAIITAADVSAPALEVARGNAKDHGVTDRIRFIQSDGFGGVNEEYDLIIANPPYIPSGEMSALQPEVRDFEPRLALDGGVDGLDFYRRLASEGGRHLKTGGLMAMEFGDGQASEIAEMLVSRQWIVEPPMHDYNGRPRILVAARLMSNC